jgi:hypothetical protein
MLIFKKTNLSNLVIQSKLDNLIKIQTLDFKPGWI